MLPWGRLLEGIVLPDDEVLRGIATLCRPGARVDVTLNGEIWEDSTPVKFRHLPPPTPEYVAEVVAPAFGRVGIDLEPARWLHAAEAKALREHVGAPARRRAGAPALPPRRGNCRLVLT